MPKGYKFHQVIGGLGSIWNPVYEALDDIYLRYTVAIDNGRGEEVAAAFRAAADKL